MQKRSLNGKPFFLLRGSAVLSALMLLCLLFAAACAAPAADSRLAPAPAEAPEATSAETSAMSLRVVQVVHNRQTQRRQESVFDESVSVGKSYTVKTASGAWSLTFTLTGLSDGAATIQTDRLMYTEGHSNERTDTFTIPLEATLRIDEPLKNIEVWYTFTLYDPLTATPLPEGTVQFTNRFIASNIRRTLHESGRSAFTAEELSLILFVELKNVGVDDISELAYLPKMETLLLRDTSVTDLSPLSGCDTLRTLVLDGNKLLDYGTMPALSGLRTLSIAGDCPEDTLLLLQTLLPNCAIITE